MEPNLHSDPESDLHPDLALPRLRAVATMEAEVRKGVAEATSNEKGDTKWSRACLALDRRIKLFSTTQGTPGFEWLTVQNNQRHVVIRVGVVPLRIYTVGLDANEAPSRYATQMPDEAMAIQEAFGFYNETIEDADPILRLAVGLDSKYEVSEIRLVKLDREGKVLDVWPISGDGETGTASAPLIDTPKPPPVDLGEPVVGLRQETDKQAEGPKGA